MHGMDPQDEITYWRDQAKINAGLAEVGPLFTEDEVPVAARRRRQAMSERLSDEELFEALEIVQDMRSLRLTSAIAELRERRAADLSSDDVAALHFAIGVLEHDDPHLDRFFVASCEKAIAVLSRLVERKP